MCVDVVLQQIRILLVAIWHALHDVFLHKISDVSIALSVVPMTHTVWVEYLRLTMALVTQINRDNSKSFICDYNSAAVHIICYFCSNTINYYMNIDENMTFSKSTSRRHCYVVSNLGTIDYIRKWELDEDLLEVCLFWFRCIKSSIRSYECSNQTPKSDEL